MKNLSFLFAALLFAGFLFSCSNSDENPFAEPRLYCVNSVERTCVSGVFKECPSGAAPKDVCPAGFVEKAPSSSSGGGGSSSSGGGGKGNDIANYKTKKIGTQTWMAENLNYAVERSKCGGTDLIMEEVFLDEYHRLFAEDCLDECLIAGLTLEDCLDECHFDFTFTPYTLEDRNTANCDKYGRLYDWATAMNLPSNCNKVNCPNMIEHPHRGICPSGWHIPNNDDWNKLFLFVNNIPVFFDWDSYTEEDLNNWKNKYLEATNYLKAKNGWNTFEGKSGNGEDNHDFSALSGGGGFYGIAYRDAGNYGLWWSSSEQGNGHDADVVFMLYGYGGESFIEDWDFDDKPNLYSVRCVKD